MFHTDTRHLICLTGSPVRANSLLQLMRWMCYKPLTSLEWGVQTDSVDIHLKSVTTEHTTVSPTQRQWCETILTEKPSGRLWFLKDELWSFVTHFCVYVGCDGLSKYICLECSVVKKEIGILNSKWKWMKCYSRHSKPFMISSVETKHIKHYKRSPYYVCCILTPLKPY